MKLGNESRHHRVLRGGVVLRARYPCTYAHQVTSRLVYSHFPISLDMILGKVSPFHRTRTRVRLCWDLDELQTNLKVLRAGCDRALQAGKKTFLTVMLLNLKFVRSRCIKDTMHSKLATGMFCSHKNAPPLSLRICLL